MPNVLIRAFQQATFETRDRLKELLEYAMLSSFLMSECPFLLLREFSYAQYTIN
jgi:hypothetical protein